MPIARGGLRAETRSWGNWGQAGKLLPRAGALRCGGVRTHPGSPRCCTAGSRSGTRWSRKVGEHLPPWCAPAHPPPCGAVPPGPAHHSLQPRRIVSPAARGWGPPGPPGCRQPHCAGGTQPPACSSSPCQDRGAWGGWQVPPAPPTPPASVVPAGRWHPGLAPAPGGTVPLPIPSPGTPPPEPLPSAAAPCPPLPSLACGQAQPGRQGGGCGQSWGCCRLEQSRSQGGPQGWYWKGGAQLVSAGETGQAGAPTRAGHPRQRLGQGGDRQRRRQAGAGRDIPVRAQGWAGAGREISDVQGQGRE